MKEILLILTILQGPSSFHQDTTYYYTLRKSISLSNVGYSTGNFQELANTCERIIAVKPGEWLPLYYCAYAYINMSFIEKNTDKKNAYCKKAKTLVAKAVAINPKESELEVLEALLCYAFMEINPMVNGLKYLPKANKALEKAEAINPENPRIYFLKGKSTMYMPEFFGGGRKAAYPILKKALELFNEFIPETNLHPDWGKSSTVELLNECEKEKE